MGEAQVMGWMDRRVMVSLASGDGLGALWCWGILLNKISSVLFNVTNTQKPQSKLPAHTQ